MRLEILDGAIGTELIARGLVAEGPGWSALAAVEAPELLAEVHREYASAGATLHTANTFRTQPVALGERWENALEASVRVAREAVPDDHRVLGSLAPVADCYRPDLSPGRASRAAHAQVADALAGSGCDVILCETFANPDEALVASEEAVRTGRPAWLSLTAGPFGTLLTPAEVRAIGERAVGTGVVRLLVNCVAASRIAPYLEAISGLGVPVGVYANAGAEAEALGWGVSGAKAGRAYAQLARGWVDAGATVVGGCCGTGPAHVAALAERFG